MKEFFSLDSKLWIFLGKVWDSVWLSLLWLVCSIPIVTIGASTSAVYYVTLKMVKDEEGYVTKQFFHSFVQNLKQGIVMWIIMLIIGLILGMNIYLCYQDNTTKGNVLLVAMFVLSLCYLMLLQYLFPVLSRFDNSVKNLFMISFLMAVKNLGWTILMTVILLLSVVIIYFFPPYAGAAVGVAAFSESYFLVHIFQVYTEKIIGKEQESVDNTD